MPSALKRPMEATSLALGRWSHKTFVEPLVARSASDDGSASPYSTHGGTRFFRDRLILVCKTIACIDVIYFALFTLALSLDSNASFWTLVAESFSLETLGEYLLLGAVWTACRVGSLGTRALRVMD